ncbi:MAG: hypothetical protein JW839_01220 [Candidatus Lokiarchaeota archaeon]|nr:hypothetical protein [Candidatus Lokiarchaeota archaeon]
MKTIGDVVGEALADDSVIGIRLTFSSQMGDRIELKKAEFDVKVLSDGLMATHIQKRLSALYPFQSIQSIGLMK